MYLPIYVSNIHGDWQVMLTNDSVSGYQQMWRLTFFLNVALNGWDFVVTSHGNSASFGIAATNHQLQRKIQQRRFRW